MKTIKRYNVQLGLWEIGYYDGCVFKIVAYFKNKMNSES